MQGNTLQITKFTFQAVLLDGNTYLNCEILNLVYLILNIHAYVILKQTSNSVLECVRSTTCTRKILF